jgi:fructokinase
MRKIFAIGETLLDIIFSKGNPQTAKAGGAMLNSAVSLGRIKLPVCFISEYGTDDIGNLVNDFLIENGVDTSMVNRFQDGKTALALAFLDEHNNAHYSFYKNYPSERMVIKKSPPSKNDIILFGSFFAIDPEIRKQLIGFITKAKENGAIIIYDPNFRKSHQDELEILRPMIIENMKAASIIRGSDEDFSNIFGAKNPDQAWDKVNMYCNCIIYTSSSAGVYVRTDTFSGKFPVKKISPVSTIGAGDNFNAGIIASFFTENFKEEDIRNLEKDQWEKIISAGVEFASNVCMSYDNYIDLAFASRYLSASGFQM